MFLVRDNKDWKEFYFIEKVKNAIQAKKKLRETCEKTVLTVSVKTGFQNFDVKNAPRFWKSGWNQEDKAKVPIEANWRTTIRKIATRSNLSNSIVHNRVKRFGVSCDYEKK